MTWVRRPSELAVERTPNTFLNCVNRRLMKRKNLVRFLLLVILCLGAYPTALASEPLETMVGSPQPAPAAYPAAMQLVSVASDGARADASNYTPGVSADGRYVTFDSDATNLVPNDTNGSSDVFLHDRSAGQVTRASVASDGTQASGGSYFSSISDDGRYVAFESSATNLTPGDSNGHSDVFVYDSTTGQIVRVSVASAGTPANGGSYLPAISGNGRYVAFESSATNLVAGDTNGYPDIFVHDRTTGETVRVSVASDGTQANKPSYLPSISGDGRYVAFETDATNLVAGDTNGHWDIVVHDRSTGQTSRVSVTSDGTQANGDSHAPAISGDGRYVAFESDAANLVAGDTNASSDVFVHDFSIGQTTRVSTAADGAQANGGNYAPSISADGRYVAFESDATNLMAGDTNASTDIFVRDRTTSRVAWLSVAADGTPADDSSRAASVAGAGRYVAFESDASNLAASDTNNSTDVFIYDLLLACPDVQSPRGVGNEDIQMFSDHWREQMTALDLDGDDVITVADVMRAATAWGSCS